MHSVCTYEQQDNDGPPSEAQLAHFFALAQQMFPRARVLASTYEAFYTELQTVRASLPVITDEIESQTVSIRRPAG